MVLAINLENKHIHVSEGFGTESFVRVPPSIMRLFSELIANTIFVDYRQSDQNDQTPHDMRLRSAIMMVPKLEKTVRYCLAVR